MKKVRVYATKEPWLFFNHAAPDTQAQPVGFGAVIVHNNSRKGDPSEQLVNRATSASIQRKSSELSNSSQWTPSSKILPISLYTRFTRGELPQDNREPRVR